jgi:hypothetical protein
MFLRAGKVYHISPEAIAEMLRLRLRCYFARQKALDSMASPMLFCGPAAVLRRGRGGAATSGKPAYGTL